MSIAVSSPSVTKTQTRMGNAFSGLSILFLLFDAVIKLIPIAAVTEGFSKLGYPPGIERPIGALLLTCVLLYVVPRTSILGAVLLTGYLGGAVNTHVRIADPLFTHTLFPVYVGAFAWAGLYLRNPRLRILFLAETQSRAHEQAKWNAR
jgi:hypothetical protein